MPESTVLDSVFGALGSMASASDRRAREGLEAAQAEEVAIRNTANKKILEQNAAQELAAEIDGLGFMKFNDDGSYDVDVIGLSAASPSLASKFLAGGNADRWFNHTGPDGKPTNLTFSRFVEVPTQMGTAPAPAAPAMGAMPNQLGQQLDAAKGPISLLPGQIPQAPAAAPADAPAAAPKRYMMLLKNEKGEEVPATQNGSKDPKDPLITMSEDDIREKGRLATVRLQALKGMQNDVTLQKQQIELSTIVEENLRQQILDSGGEALDFDAAAKREFLDAVDTADADELREMAGMVGIDPDAIRKEAEDAWTANVKAKVENSNLKPTTGFDYDKTKAGLEDLATKAEKALADYDAKAARSNTGAMGGIGSNFKNAPMGGLGSKPSTGAMGIGGPLELRDARRPTSAPAPQKPKDTPERKKLQAAAEFARSAANNIVRPAVKDALPTGTPEPKFEWTDENLRASIRGELDQPTPEQSSALAQYGQSQGIKQASDLSRVPPARAKALVWAIVANSGGTPDEKMKLFDNLNSYVQTGDPDKSAMDANLEIARVANVAEGNRVQERSNIRSTNASIYGDNLRNQQWGADRADKAGEAAWKKSEDVVAAFKSQVDPWLTDIQEGTIEENGEFKQLASPTALLALKKMSTEIKRDFTTSLSVAAQPYYAESFLKVLVAQAGEGSGVSLLWDWAKGFANMFMRTEPRETMSAIAGSWRVKKWKNGKPEQYALMEPFRDDGNKPTERTIGALELGRYVGVDAMNTMNDIIYSQRAKDELETAGEDASPAAVEKRRRELYEADAKAGQ